VRLAALWRRLWTVPSWPLAHSYLCLNCQRVLCGPGHWDCARAGAPTVVSLPAYLTEKAERIARRTRTLARTTPGEHQGATALSTKEADTARAHADFWWQGQRHKK